MKKNIEVFAKKFNISHVSLLEYEYSACDVSEILKILNYIGLDNFEIKSIIYQVKNTESPNIYIKKDGLKITFHYNFKDRKEFKNKYYKFLSHPDVLKYFYVR